VRGKATLKELLFEGQKRIKEPRLRKELSQKVGDVYDERKANDDARKMVELYQKGGSPDAQVLPEASVDSDTGKAILRFKITEGPRVFIRRIRFTDLQAMKPAQLHKILKTRRRWWGSWFAGTGVLKDEQFREDLESLREHYRAQGYLDMEIRGTRTERVAEHWMVVHLDLFEGARYQVGEVGLAGNTLYSESDLRPRLRMTTGNVFTPGGLTADLRALEDYYGSRGYLDTVVRPVQRPNIDTHRIDLIYQVREGALTYIEHVQIRGNTKTKDKVLRRELAVVPGEIYDTVRVERSAERLRNLGFFSKVDTTPHATEVPNRKDLVITVEEQRTGSMTFGAGFSSVDNLLGFVELTQGNFDLFNWPNFTGGGQKIRLRLQLGFQRQDVVLSFVEPWFLDRKLALGIDAFHRESSYLSEDFDEGRSGGAIRLEKALTEFIRGQIQYSIQSIRLDVDSSASAELQAEDGGRLRSAVELSLTYDTRDNVFLTTRGNRTAVSFEVAGGPFGGDVGIYKLEGKTSQFFPLPAKQVFMLQASAGVVDAFGAGRGDGPYVVEPSDLSVVKVNDVPIFDRQFLGGPYSLRGFDYREISPRDVNNEPVGGNTFVAGTAEYTFPIVERIRGALFFDIGNVWRDSYEFGLSDLVADVGVGVRLNLPVGPLRLDYGYPVITNDEVGQNGRFQFSVGYQF